MATSQGEEGSCSLAEPQAGHKPQLKKLNRAELGLEDTIQKDNYSTCESMQVTAIFGEAKAYIDSHAQCHLTHHPRWRCAAQQ